MPFSRAAVGMSETAQLPRAQITLLLSLKVNEVERAGALI